MKCVPTWPRGHRVDVRSALFEHLPGGKLRPRSDHVSTVRDAMFHCPTASARPSVLKGTHPATYVEVRNK